MRHGIIIGMYCLIANAFLAAAVILGFSARIGGSDMISTLRITWAPLLVIGMMLSCWTWEYREWWHEKIIEEKSNGLKPGTDEYEKWVEDHPDWKNKDFSKPELK